VKGMLAAAATVLAVAVIGHAELVSERWGGKDAACAHPDRLQVFHAGKARRLVFDLSALPGGARVHHASLYCLTQGNRQPNEPARIFRVDKLDAEGNPKYAGRPLKLEAPWYRSFDATEAVKRWAERPSENLGLGIDRFQGLIARDCYLDILYEGKVQDLPEQVTSLSALHHDGQTFLVWNEVKDYRPKAEEVIWVEKFAEVGDKLAEGPGQGAYDMPNHPGITLKALRRLQGLAVRIKPSGFQGIKPLRRVRKVPPITYRVYRHTERITARSIRQAERIAEIGPLGGYDGDVYKIHFQGEYINQREEPDSVIPTYCIDKGKAIQPGQTLYVHTARKGGSFFYAVTTALGGTENLIRVGDANSLTQPIAEKPGTPRPVPQWVQEDHYHKDVPEYWYRYWAAPPYWHLPSRSFRVAVSAPKDFKQPGPLNIGSISGTFNVRGSLRLPPRTEVTLLVESHHAWMPNLFYNEGLGTLRGMTECRVDYFTENYMDFMIKWIMGKYGIDRSRVHGTMLHFGLRHPEIFPKMSFGSYTAGYDLRWAPGGPSMPGLLGPKGIKTARGEDAWKMYSVAEYVNAHPDRDIPFLICISATGKDGGHTSEFGWQDDPRGWAGLLKAHQPFAAAWSCGLPRELSQGLNKLRWDLTIPAFANCSLDNNPGSGDPVEGDYYGQINGWLLWEDAGRVDEKDRWEMTVRVISSCPEEACTVDITPRHCRNFRPAPGKKFKWTNTSLQHGELIKSGQVTADKWGLVTLKAVSVDKGRNRIVISAQ